MSIPGFIRSVLRVAVSNAILPIILLALLFVSAMMVTVTIQGLVQTAVNYLPEILSTIGTGLYTTATLVAFLCGSYTLLGQPVAVIFPSTQPYLDAIAQAPANILYRCVRAIERVVTPVLDFWSAVFSNASKAYSALTFGILGFLQYVFRCTLDKLDAAYTAVSSEVSRSLIYCLPTLRYLAFPLTRSVHATRAFFVVLFGMEVVEKQKVDPKEEAGRAAGFLISTDAAEATGQLTYTRDKRIWDARYDDSCAKDIEENQASHLSPGEE